MAFYRRKPDIIIRGGTVVDGTGKLPYYADVAVIGDKIDYIGDLTGVTAPLEIDAHHKYVTPGFIDCHSHSDRALFSRPEFQNAIRQGVTTEIVGNCGFSMRGYTKQNPETAHPDGDGIDCVYTLPGPTYPKGSVAAALDKAEKLGTGVNTAWLCGHNDLRVMAGLTTRDYTEEQFQIMADFLREAMEAGFIGFSTGLEFVPGSVSRPEEVERLAMIAAEYDANYSTHMRDEGYYVLEAVNEFLNVIRKTGLRGTVSHLNVKYDNGVPDEYLFKGMQMLKDAREIEHLNVYADMLPTLFATGGAMAMLPSWLYADGWDKAREILADPAGRSRVKNDLDRYWRFLAKGQWDRLLFIKPGHDPEIAKMPFSKLVEQSGKEPADVFLDVMMGAKTMEEANAVSIQGTVFFEEIMVDSVVKDPIYMWQTDSTVSDLSAGDKANVLNYISMIYFFIRYVRDLGVISIQDAVKKVGSVPAQHFMLEGRGVLEAGKYADINVFDIHALKMNATPEDPCHYSEGMDYVIVNGVPVIAKGEYTGKRPGRVLRHLPKE
ncbi:MAG: amidohydrolase family protein [Oscillospiraceae bacterium]|nr:amidohydrolase family protein [Oscillospiraceae bacterium]